MENDKGTLSVRLQELTVREVLDMCEQFGKGPLVHDLERLLPRMSNLTTNDLMDMTPGELEMLWEQDTNLLRQSIRKITYDSKTVKVLLKNNQVLEECDDT